MSVVTRSASKKGVTGTRSGRRSSSSSSRSSFKPGSSTKRRKSKKTTKSPKSNKKHKSTQNATVSPENVIANNTRAAASPNSILMSPRENEFSARSWWIVDLQQQQQHNSALHRSRQGATALVARCMRRYGWLEARARRVLAAYQQFLQIKRITQDWDATILSPCLLVDRMWHEHILDVTNYCHDTMLLCGHVVGHNPDGGLDVAAKAERTKNTLKALEEEFGEDGYDAELWLSPHEFRGKQLVQQRGQSLQQLQVVHQVHTICGGRGNTNEKQVTIILEHETKDIQLIRFPTQRKLSEVFSSYYETIYDGDAPLRSDLHFFSSNHVEIRDEETADDMKLEDGDKILVLNENDTFTIRLRDQTGEETFYRVWSGTDLSTVFDNYAQRKGVCVGSLRFMVDGQEVVGFETPQSLDLDDQDQIDCLLEQCGC